MSPDLFAKKIFVKPNYNKTNISPNNAFTDPYKNAQRADKVSKHQLNKKVDLNNVEEVTEYSAGGLVLANSKIVLIAKKSKKGRKEWTFPKGHIEPNESPEIAAVREVFEETGLKTRIAQKVGVSDYTFYVGNNHIHKFVHFFALSVISGRLTLPNNLEENIVDINWVDKKQLFKLLAFPAEKKIAKFFFDRLKL
jgi:8-oxo-dGTP pyrophosphatase MutT (NUDIX family)